MCKEKANWETKGKMQKDGVKMGGGEGDGEFLPEGSYFDSEIFVV